MNFNNIKEKRKSIVIGMVILLAIGVVFFSERDTFFPKEHPINSIKKMPIDTISVSQAKYLFDITYDDETGAHKPVAGKMLPGESGKMVEIFRRAKPTPENKFYLARMLLIHAYQPYPAKSKEESISHFQEGYALLMDLAHQGYAEAQFYLAKVTLTPKSVGMFSEQFYNRIRLPRHTPGMPGSSQWCQRLHFTNAQKDQFIKLISEEQKVDNYLDNDLIFAEYFRSLRAITAPKSNGYGLKYHEAIAYLDAAGRNGNREGYRVLQNYFDSLLKECPTLWEPREITIMRWLSAKYKKLLKNKAP